jgi:soluble lytic murein transglycosylase
MPSPTPDILEKRASLFAEAHLYSDATELYQQLLAQSESEEKKYDYRYQLGRVLFRAQKYREAAEQFSQLQQAVESGKNLKSPDDILFWAAFALCRAGNFEAGQQIYQKIIEQYPGTATASKSRFKLGLIAEQNNQLEAALPYYRQIYEGPPTAPHFEEAVWKLAWLAFRQRSYDASRQYLESLIQQFPRSAEVDRYVYWRARSELMMGNSAAGRATLQKLIEEYPVSYYAFIAQQSKLISVKPALDVANSEQDELLQPFLPLFSGDFDESSAASDYTLYATITDYLNRHDVEQRVHLQKSVLLYLLDLPDDAAAELKYFLAANPKKPDILFLGSILYRKCHKNDRSLGIIQSYFQKDLRQQPGSTTWHTFFLGYPNGYQDLIARETGRRNLDPDLAQAVILEESHYQPEILSPVGAIGLFQIMPITGQKLASSLGLTNYAKADLKKPEVAIPLGVYYLRQLLDMFSENEFFAVAGYNAGEDKVREWQKAFPDLPNDEFVECIPYAETRNYVKKVLRSKNVYHLVYGNEQWPPQK